MTIPPQEVPLILTISVGTFGMAFIHLYRNFLCTKNERSAVQTTYAWSAVAAAIVSITQKISPSPLLFWLDWGFSIFWILYFLTSCFSPCAPTALILSWSDVFLVVLFMAFFALKYYATTLLTYHRLRTPKIKKGGLLPNPVIPDTERWHAYDESNNED